MVIRECGNPYGARGGGRFAGGASGVVRLMQDAIDAMTSRLRIGENTVGTVSARCVHSVARAPASATAKLSRTQTEQPRGSSYSIPCARASFRAGFLVQMLE
jgi:hypothetical protein